MTRTFDFLKNEVYIFLKRLNVVIIFLVGHRSWTPRRSNSWFVLFGAYRGMVHALPLRVPFGDGHGCSVHCRGWANTQYIPPSTTTGFHGRKSMTIISCSELILPHPNLEQRSLKRHGVYLEDNLPLFSSSRINQLIYELIMYVFLETNKCIRVIFM